MITKVKFTIAWSIAMVSRGGDSFHQQVQVGYHAHLLGYKGVDLGFRIKAQQIASQLVITRRRKTGCVLTTLHPPNPLVPFHHLNLFVATLALARDQGKGVARLRAYK
jgi:hypothetical protein